MRRRTGSGAGFVLADYFDYVAGTNTGAIIAACIARVMSAEEIARLSTEHGQATFDRAFLLRWFSYRYDAGRLQDML